MKERDDEILGQALGRAVDAQDAREAPFESSRLASEIARPRRPPLAIVARYALAAATLVAALGAGALVARESLDRGATEPQPSGPTFTIGPTRTDDPTVVSPRQWRLASSANPRDVVFCSRPDAPPQYVRVPGSDAGATAEERITSRLRSLEQVNAELRPGSACPGGFDTTARVARVSVSNDLAMVDYTLPNGDWGHRIVRMSDPLLQQIVFTATEEPGIRRVLLTQNGGTLVFTGQLQASPTPPRRTFVPGTPAPTVVQPPLTREDVLGYAVSGSTEAISYDGQAGGYVATTRWSVDQPAIGLARFVVELDTPGAAGTGRGPVPTFEASVARNAEDPRAQLGEIGDPNLAKWVLTLTVHDIREPAATPTLGPGQSGTSTSLRPASGSPLRVVAETRRTGSTDVVYRLGLDDLRPWRVAVQFDPTPSIMVDIGGPTDRVTTNLAVYAPASSSVGALTLSGAARAFEANVQWRVKNTAGRVTASGAMTASLGNSPVWGLFEKTITDPRAYEDPLLIEVFLTSPRDGAITDLVAIPVSGRRFLLPGQP